MTFRKVGSCYVSRSAPGELIPPFEVAHAARRLIEAGEKVWLPQGYDVSVLNQITYQTGFYETDVNVSLRQGAELAAIARHLLEAFRNKLTATEVNAIRALLIVVVD